MGICTTPTNVNTPLARAAVRLSSIAELSAITPKYKNSKMSSAVKRASHTHQVPHIGFPHNEPVAKAKKVNDAPMGAELAAIISASLIRQTNPMPAAVAITI